MATLKRVFAIAGLLLLASQAGAQYDNPFEALEATKDLSILLTAANVTGLVPTLLSPDLNVTIFAPTNDAFIALLTDLGINATQLLSNTALVSDVLSYHVVPEPLTSGAIKPGTILPTLLDGQGITPLLIRNRLIIEGGFLCNKAAVVTANITAGQTVIHIISSVLTPDLPAFKRGALVTEEPTEEPDFPTILDAALATPELATLVLALQAANLTAALNDSSLEATLFAPTNEAFATALAALGLTPEQALASPDVLGAVLLYHAVPGVAAKAADLTDGQVLPTLLDSQTLTVQLEDGSVVIETAMGNATVVTADITAGKAVIHIIDDVLVPNLVEAAA